ncbi:MAG: hypothetical protein IKP86_00325, partial [Anaerolineaceae bacterium]|nr:hypothetical protein [Anaerolineaceae bacterium]
EAELIRLLDPMLVSLQKIHDLGIVHRDILPDNIIIDEQGTPILLFDENSLNAGTNHDMVFYRPSFHPLEQLMGKSEPRSDIYALGSTYYMLLTGKEPQKSVERISGDEVKPLKDLGFTPEVSNAVMKAMELRAKDRWNSVEEFRRALNAAPEQPSEDEKKENGNTSPIDIRLLLIYIVSIYICFRLDWSEFTVLHLMGLLSVAIFTFLHAVFIYLWFKNKKH